MNDYRTCAAQEWQLKGNLQLLRNQKAFMEGSPPCHVNRKDLSIVLLAGQVPVLGKDFILGSNFSFLPICGFETN